MPVQRCTENGKPGWKFGEAGKCYTYTPGDDAGSNKAKQKAHIQGAAIGENDMGKEQGTPLAESASFTEAKVDREAGVVRGVKIIGLVSRNGRRYSEAGLRSAATLYEGMKVCIDHDARKTGRDRSYRDRFGSLQTVRFERDGLYGDLHYNPRHPVAEQFVWDAEHAPENVGLSHIAFGKSKRDKDQELVEEILEVRSVDLVCDPATTATLYESYEPEPEEEKPVKTTVRQVLAAMKDKHPIAKLFCEQEGLDPMMAAEMPAPATDASAEDQVAGAFKAMVMAVLDDASLDVAGKVAKIKEILKAEEKLTTAAEEAPAGEEAPAAESIDPKMADLTAKVARLEGQNAAYALLSEAKLPHNPAWVEAIAALAPEKRKPFVESLPRIEYKPPRSGQRMSEQKTDTPPKDSKEFVASIT